jgi:hypothetical protein
MLHDNAHPHISATLFIHYRNCTSIHHTVLTLCIRLSSIRITQRCFKRPSYYQQETVHIENATFCNSTYKARTMLDQVYQKGVGTLKNALMGYGMTVVFILQTFDHLCGLVVRVLGYRSWGLGFDSQRYQIFWEAVGLERGPLSLMRITE